LFKRSLKWRLWKFCETFVKMKFLKLKFFFETFVKMAQNFDLCNKKQLPFWFYMTYMNLESSRKIGLYLVDSSGFEFFNPKIQSPRRMFTKNPELNILEWCGTQINICSIIYWNELIIYNMTCICTKRWEIFICPFFVHFYLSILSQASFQSENFSYVWMAYKFWID
jgi:hypothetical protein